jgi:hypothetical protein
VDIIPLAVTKSWYYPQHYLYDNHADFWIGKHMKSWDWLETEKTRSVLRLGYWLDDKGIWLKFPGKGRDFSLLDSLQVFSWVHPDSYPMSTEGPFPGSEADGVCADHSYPCRAEDEMCHGHGVEMVKHRNNFTFYPSWRLNFSYFPHFKEMKRGLRNHLAIVCVSICVCLCILLCLSLCLCVPLMF